MDTDLASDLGGNGRNQSRTFVFIDACFSGGLIEELLDSIPRVVGTTTCTRKGFGYDDERTHSGAWTHGFLTRWLVPNVSRNLDREWPPSGRISRSICRACSGSPIHNM